MLQLPKHRAVFYTLFSNCVMLTVWPPHSEYDLYVCVYACMCVCVRMRDRVVCDVVTFSLGVGEPTVNNASDRILPFTSLSACSCVFLCVCVCGS